MSENATVRVLTRRIVVIVAGLCAAIVALPASAVQYYTAVSLGGTNIAGNAINNTGEITGWDRSEPSSGLHAFLYSGGTITDLYPLGDLGSEGQGINNKGQVTGYGRNYYLNQAFAFLYSGGTITYLGTLGPPVCSAAGFGINDSGQVTGYAETGRDFICGAVHAFLYSSGTMTDLGTLGGTNSQGHGINNGGQVVGYSDTTGNAAVHAFLYSSGTMTDLGTLGGTNSQGHGINNNGQVVGGSDTTGNAAVHAFLYSSGAMFDLNALVVGGLSGDVLTYASGINDVGQIIATSCAHSPCQAYRLDPIAGPATVTTVPTLSQGVLGALVLSVFVSGLLLRRRPNR